MEKDQVRKIVREQKRRMSKETVVAYSNRIMEQVKELPEVLAAETIFCYCSYNQEVETLSFIQWALEKGKEVAVPKVTGNEIEFYQIHSLKELVPGYQGIPEPISLNTIACNQAVILLPGLAFDLSGNRVGYGKGFYDRYLNQHEQIARTKIGVCFSFQLMDQIACEEYDEPWDILVTEYKTIRRGK